MKYDPQRRRLGVFLLFASWIIGVCVIRGPGELPARFALFAFAFVMTIGILGALALIAMPCIDIVRSYLNRHELEKADRALHHLCTECGYSLQGNVSGVCPECGKEIASAEPSARTARRVRNAAWERSATLAAIVLVLTLLYSLLSP